MKKIITIFTGAKDVHLSKDVGQVINYLANERKIQATLVTYKNEKEYSQLNNEAKNIKIKFIKNYGNILNIELAVIFYLITNSKNIDILNLYGNRISNLLYIFIYKNINKSGFSYIKMDDDIRKLLKENKNKVKYKLKRIIYKLISKKVDLYTVETKNSYRLLIKKYKEFKNKTEYLPNCVNDIYIDQKFIPKNYLEKENIILVVGRIGSKQKNHELLLEAVSNIDLKNWKIIFIGKIEDNFQNYIKNYLDNNKKNENKIIFKGEIKDRDKLYEWYNRSKIFCLPSKYENFSLACIEALYFRNWIIATRMTSTEEISLNGAIFHLFNEGNIDELRACITEAINEKFLDEHKIGLIQKQAEKYRWSERIKTLENSLKI